MVRVRATRLADLIDDLTAERAEGVQFASLVRAAAREIHRAIPTGDMRRIEQRSGEIVSRSDRHIRQRTGGIA